MVSCTAISCVVVRRRNQQPRYKPSPSMTSYPLTSPGASRSSRYLNPAFRSDDDYLLATTSWNIRPTELPSARKNITYDWTLVGTNQLPDKKLNPSKPIENLHPYYESNATLCKDQLVSPSAASESSHTISFYSEKTPSAVVSDDGITGQFTQIL